MSQDVFFIISDLPMYPKSLIGPHHYPLLSLDANTMTCKVDEEWQKRDKGYGCFCKPPHNITGMYARIQLVNSIGFLRYFKNHLALQIILRSHLR